MMIAPGPGTKVYLACRPTDMRKGFNGLSAQVANCFATIPIPVICSFFAASAATA